MQDKRDDKANYPAYLAGLMMGRGMMRFLVWFVRLSRGGNLFLLGSSLYLAAVFLVAPRTPIADKLMSWRLLVAVVATACVTAAGYIINDYFDVQIDRVNKPGQTIVGRYIARRRAQLLHWGLSIVGIALGFVAGWRVGALEAVAVGALLLYSAYLKRTAGWGNVIVAGLSALSLFVPLLIFGDLTKGFGAFVAFSFFVSLIREVVKDMEDMRGDAQFGCRTLPIVYGIPRTRQIVFGLLGAFYGVVFTASAQIGWPLVCYNLLLVAPGAIIIRLLPVADTKAQFRSLSNLCKMMMAVGLLGMAFV